MAASPTTLFDDPPPGSFHLAGAPFAAIRFGIGDTGDLVEAPDQVDVLEKRLCSIADAKWAAIDSEEGVFRLDIQAPGADYDVPIVAVPFIDPSEWRRISRLGEGERTKVVQSVGRIWNTMTDHLGLLVSAGLFEIRARELTPLARQYSVISPHIWNYFRIEDWVMGTSLCPLTNERLFGVRLVQKTAPRASQKTAKGRAVCLKYLIEERTIPEPPRKTRAAYEKYCMEQFAIAKYTFDQCWQQAIAAMPNELWNKPGRPPKTGFHSA